MNIFMIYFAHLLALVLIEHLTNNLTNKYILAA